MSPREILAFLERTTNEDGTKATGTVYWPLNSDVRSATRSGEVAEWSKAALCSIRNRLCPRMVPGYPLPQSPLNPNSGVGEKIRGKIPERRDGLDRATEASLAGTENRGKLSRPCFGRGVRLLLVSQPLSAAAFRPKRCF